MRRSRTSRWVPRRPRSRPVPCAAPIAWPSTTSCCASSANWANARAIPARGHSRLNCRSMRPWIFAILLLMLAGLQYRLWVGDGGIAHTHQLQQELERDRAEVERLRNRNAALDAEVRSLKSGLDEIEARARQSLGMVRQGETFYLV